MKAGLQIESVKNWLRKSKFSEFKSEYMKVGVSTDVFKLTNDSSIFYLRILPKEENIEVQVRAHEFIIKKEVSIPEIVLGQKEILGLQDHSLMIVKEIPGKS